ncbi:MAG: carbamoyltransferase C-terminal domain-containing protein [Planctomycetaceae bacterium]
MIVLGIKAGGHDTGAAAIMERGRNLHIVAISEERLNRSKHSRQFPLMSIDYCLKAFGLDSLGDVDLVAIDRHMRELDDPEYARTPTKHPQSDHRPDFNFAVYHSLDYQGAKATAIHHLYTHAASAYYLSPFQEAAILIVDAGLGIYTGRENKIITHDVMGYGPTKLNGEIIEQNIVPGTGMLFDAVTKHLGYDQFGAGKTMALASYGHLFEKRNPLAISPDRHRSVFIDYTTPLRKMYAELPEFDAEKEFKGAEAILSPEWVQLARQTQETLQQDMVFLAQEAVRKSETRNLCLAGGVALSCVTNRHIYDSGVCDELFIQPAASDEGVPLGCALAAYYMHGGTLRAVMNHAYLGRPNNPATLETILQNSGLPHRTVEESEVAKLLADGKIIGRVFGRAEYGPRALGNRSILADPRRPYMTDVLNRRIKHREMYRPFAPSCHADKVNDYFDMPIEGPFMIFAAPVRPEARHLLPAIVHVDGSCRPQTVRPDQNPEYYRLIDEFGKRTGVYCLINTSFNDNREPIVETYEDAISSFLRTELDHLYVDGYLVDRPANSKSIPADLMSRPTLEETHQKYDDLVEKFCHPERYKVLREETQPRHDRAA